MVKEADAASKNDILSLEFMLQKKASQINN